MKSLRQIKTLPLIITMLVLMFVGALHLPSANTLAQGSVLPTPTNIGDGGGGGSGGQDSSDDGDTIPAPAGAGVSGFVYNYSSAVYEGGVTVVVDGGGWQIETVTDSNGFYKISGLGAGRAVVSLRLPPAGPQPATIDWPVRLVSEADQQVNLGYYWGDDPPIPVILLGDLENNRLNIQIENRTPVTATGGLVEILPRPM